MMISAKDIRKGTNVVLRNGWTARIEDNNTRGQTRMATVFGDYTEMGSIYATDIVEADMGGNWELVQHTPAQLKAAQVRKGWGF